jgi:signal transduction histidine kinase
MPKEVDFDALEEEIAEMLDYDQRQWLARLLHDHVSGLVTNLAMQIEIVNKMIERDMPIDEEMASLKENISATSAHIVEIERIVRPHSQD